MLNFSKELKEKISNLTDFKEYFDSVSKFPRRSIRVNTLKISVNELRHRLKNYKLEQVPWCKEGFFISGERRDIGNLLEHFLGYFYVQDAASMLPAIILEPEGTVLDMCAAPGSKTTHIAALMNNKGLIIANDKDAKRLTPLKLNLQRCSVVNTVVTQSDALSLKGSYDKILLDAPCSDSGTIHGDTKHSVNTLKILKPNLIKKLSKLQKKLILHAYSLLNKNGTLVYSTCSIFPEENEEVVDYLVKNTDAKVEKIIRIWPQSYNTNGFFVAKIKS